MMESLFALIQDFMRSPHLIGAAAAGIVAAVIDRRLIGRPLLGILIVLAAVAGEIAMRVNPLPYLGGDYYVLGVLLSTFALSALAGYVVAALAVRLFWRSA